jgi:hypothetical protein
MLPDRKLGALFARTAVDAPAYPFRAIAPRCPSFALAVSSTRSRPRRLHRTSRMPRLLRASASTGS